MAPKRSSNGNDILALLCYILWPVALILLLLDKREGDLRYHSINGLGWGLTWWIIGSIASWIFWFASSIVWIAGLIYAIILGIQAYNGKKPVIPVVTDLLRQNVRRF